MHVVKWQRLRNDERLASKTTRWHRLWSLRIHRGLNMEAAALHIMKSEAVVVGNVSMQTSLMGSNWVQQYIRFIVLALFSPFLNNNAIDCISANVEASSTEFQVDCCPYQDTWLVHLFLSSIWRVWVFGRIDSPNSNLTVVRSYMPRFDLSSHPRCPAGGTPVQLFFHNFLRGTAIHRLCLIGPLVTASDRFETQFRKIKNILNIPKMQEV